MPLKTMGCGCRCCSANFTMAAGTNTTKSGNTFTADAPNNSEVVFTDTSTSPVSWAWEFGDGGTSTSQNPSHTYVTSGTYTVTLTIENAGGQICEHEEIIIVTDRIPCSPCSPDPGDAWIVDVGAPTTQTRCVTECAATEGEWVVETATSACGATLIISSHCRSASYSLGNCTPCTSGSRDVDFCLWGSATNILTGGNWHKHIEVELRIKYGASDEESCHSARAGYRSASLGINNSLEDWDCRGIHTLTKLAGSNDTLCNFPASITATII